MSEQRLHPDDVRDQLLDCHRRLTHAAQERRQAIEDVARLAPHASRLGISVTEIAALAGVSRPTVYSYLRDRDAP